MKGQDRISQLRKENSIRWLNNETTHSYLGSTWGRLEFGWKWMPTPWMTTHESLEGPPWIEYEVSPISWCLHAWTQCCNVLKTHKLANNVAATDLSTQNLKSTRWLRQCQPRYSCSIAHHPRTDWKVWGDPAVQIRSSDFLWTNRYEACNVPKTCGHQHLPSCTVWRSLRCAGRGHLQDHLETTQALIAILLVPPCGCTSSRCDCKVVPQDDHYRVPQSGFDYIIVASWQCT